MYLNREVIPGKSYIHQAGFHKKTAASKRLCPLKSACLAWSTCKRLPILPASKSLTAKDIIQFGNICLLAANPLQILNKPEKSRNSCIGWRDGEIVPEVPTFDEGLEPSTTSRKSPAEIVQDFWHPLEASVHFG